MTHVLTCDHGSSVKAPSPCAVCECVVLRKFITKLATAGGTLARVGVFSDRALVHLAEWRDAVDAAKSLGGK